jgi:hypothetical protein
MTLPQWKGTVYFNDSDGAVGWTESFYPVGSTQADAAANLLTVMEARVAFLPPQYRIVYARVDVPGAPRDSLPPAVEYPLVGTYAPTGSVLPIPTVNAVLVTLVGNPQIKNRKFIHGLLQADVDEDTFDPTTTWMTAYTDWLTAVIANCYVYSKAIGGGSSVVIAGAILDDVMTSHRVGRPFGLRRGRRRVLT